jgi:hypothetical protein
MEKYKGIDYGLGRSNIGENGIRYGVINQNDVGQIWYDESEPWYADQPDDEFCEPVSFYIDNEEYSAECGEDGDIFITRSPYFTYAQFCSPCAPGAVYLTDFIDEKDPNNRGYCFGHDMFEETYTGQWIECPYCKGSGNRLKKDIPNYSEERFRTLVLDSKRVLCWYCNENEKYGMIGMVKETIQKAPYPVFSVETGELVEP